MLSKTERIKRTRTDLSIRELTYGLGFDEPTNFVKFFKRYNPQSPNQFRKSHNVKQLLKIGAADVLIEGPKLNEQSRLKYSNGLNSVMDIVGNTTLLDSLSMVKKARYVCNAGFLGGGDPIAFNPLVDMPPSVNLTFFASFMYGTKNFPISDILMQEMMLIPYLYASISISRVMKNTCREYSIDQSAGAWRFANGTLLRPI